MLLNKVKETTNLIKLESEVNENKKINEDFKRVFKRLELIEKAFNNYYKTIKTLNKEYGIEYKYDDLNLLKRKLKKLKENLKGEYIDMSLIDAITKETNELEQFLKEKWNLYIVSETNGLINTLKTIRSIVNDKPKVDIVVHSIMKDRVAWPVDNDKLNNINNKKKEAQKLISDLGLNKNISDFIEKIALNQATILDLTPEILDWVRNKEFENNIALRFI
ncbi:MAG: hypothetical protein ACLTYB_15185 [Clostridium paraputrificum]